jgi:SulP family sulfate permease
MQLQGYLFFGIADRLLAGARERIEDSGSAPLRYLVLDFRRVSGCDSSAVQSFVRLHDLLDGHGATLVVCHASSAVRAQLRAADLNDDARSPYFDDLDHGLAWCEARLLEAAGRTDPATPETGLHDLIERSSHQSGSAHRLLAGFDRIALATGETLIVQGADSTELYLLQSGSLSAQRERAGVLPLRLQTMSGGGQVFGEVGFFLNEPRTASVVADEPSVVYRLTMSQLHEMERHQPALAATLLRLVAELLAARVAHLVSVVDALER